MSSMLKVCSEFFSFFYLFNRVGVLHILKYVCKSFTSREVELCMVAFSIFFKIQKGQVYFEGQKIGELSRSLPWSLDQEKIFAGHSWEPIEPIEISCVLRVPLKQTSKFIKHTLSKHQTVFFNEKFSEKRTNV